MPAATSSIGHRMVAAALSSAASSPSKGRARFPGGSSSNGKALAFLTGLALGAGIATLLQALLAMGGSGPGGYRRAAGGKSYPFSFLTSRDLVASSSSGGKRGKRPKILVFGDSLTQRGFEAHADGGGWASGLAHIYGRRADVVNRGFSGYTSKWCALMLESLFPMADPEWEKPLVAVVFLGANDAALPSRQQHVPVTEYEAGLREIIKYLRRRGGYLGGRSNSTDDSGSGGGNEALFSSGHVRLILLTPPPVDEERWGKHCEERGRALDRKNDVTRLYAKACLAVGKEMDVPTVDLFSLLGGDAPLADRVPNLNDGLHLSGRGNALVLEAVMAAIQQHYPEVAPERIPMQAPEHFELEATTRAIEVA